MKLSRSINVIKDNFEKHNEETMANPFLYLTVTTEIEKIIKGMSRGFA